MKDVCRDYNYDSIDSDCQTVSMVTGDNGCRHLSVVTPGSLLLACLI